MYSYKQTIQEKIKEPVNNWLNELKEKHPELLLTRQWQLLFPKGFKSGQNIIPVVTGSKKGRHLVAEILFILPDSMELDMDALELVLKNEPYKTPKKSKPVSPEPFENSLDTLNDIIVGLNSFLTSLDIFHTPSSTPTLKPHITHSSAADERTDKPLNIHSFYPQQEFLPHEIKQKMLNSPHLPDWFSTIADEHVKDKLIDTLATAFIHYRQKNGNTDLKEFFDLYTDHLKKKEKLYPYCSYKAKPVIINDEGLCMENYCSKKPYREACPIAQLKFGSIS